MSDDMVCKKLLTSHSSAWYNYSTDNSVGADEGAQLRLRF